MPGVNDVEIAIKAASNSAPGPDGIPFKAWKQLINLVAPEFQTALARLTVCSSTELLGVVPNFNEASFRKWERIRLYAALYTADLCSK